MHENANIIKITTQTDQGRKVANLAEEIAWTPDMILYTGPLKGGEGSSVVDVSTPDIKMIREGEIPFNSILKALE